MQISNLAKNRCIALVILCIMLLGTGYIIGELLRPIHYETDMYDVEYNEIKSHNTNVDMVFIGSSRILKTFDPRVFEKKMQLTKVFNLGMNQQTLDGNYFQLKEFIEKFHPKTVVIGITYSGLTSNNTHNIVKLRTIHRLHGFNLMAYIKDCLSIKDYPDILSIYSFRGNIAKIRKNIKDKQQLQNEGIYIKTKNWHYMGQGFTVIPISVPPGNMGIIKQPNFNEEMINNHTLYYLDKCIQLCKENNINLVLMTPPASLSYIYSVNNFQDVINYIDDYAHKNNIIYHNLNYLKGREELLTDPMMHDYKHTNNKGAAVVSEKYAEILSKSLKNIDTSEYFYPTLSEMQKDVKRIVAVDAKPVIKNNTMTLSIQSLQNKDVIPSYQVLMAKDRNKFNPVINWTSEKNVSFAVPKKGSAYRILLRARRNETDTDYAWMAWDIDKKGKVNKIKNSPIAVR